MIKEYDDIELTNKIWSFLTRKGEERFGSANPFKMRSNIKGGTHSAVTQLSRSKTLRAINDRDKTVHYFRVASPHFNYNQ